MALPVGSLRYDADSPEKPVVGWAARQLSRVVRLAGRHPLCLDFTVAAVLAVASSVVLVVQGRVRHVDTIVFCAALCLPLTLRVRDRRLSFALVALVALAQWLVSTPQLADASVLWALFWIALDGERTEIMLACGVVEAGAIMAALRWSPQAPANVWVAITGLGVAAAALGLVIRERRALIQSMRERAARLEFERDQQGKLGATAERARIAREMHDIVSHNLTVMIGLADGAAYALGSSPEMARGAMDGVAGTGRQALGEMRRLLGVLREEPETESFAPQPDIDRLDELLAQVEAAGVPVSIDVDGDPHLLAGGVQLAVYRVAQEALTNTLKHAGRPVSAHVALRCQEGRVALTITDSGHGRIQMPVPSLPTGRGMPGIRERAAAYGGRVQAGPAPSGGWRVHLELSAEAEVTGGSPP